MKHSTYCIFVSLILVLFIGTASCEGGTNSDSLTYYGHSFVKIKTQAGVVIYIDPYAVNAFADSADILLVTHEHSDHNEITRVKQRSTCTLIRSANALQGGVYQTFNIGSVTIKAVAAYNSYHPKSSCVGYVVEFDGIKLYHAGDTGNIPETADLTSQHITYALLPMDGIYTVTPEVATQMAATINAQHDMPIHTMPPPDTYSDAIVARFTSPNKLVVHPGSTIVLSAGATGVGKMGKIPAAYMLSQNYPNPFNPSTTISFALPVQSRVLLKIYDIAGREVATLVNNEVMPAGSYTKQWNAERIPSGVYFYRLQTESSSETKKLVLLK
jgi:L-ascorbate metabolism protein UlaG (beta-lactamase superfamily)